MTKIDSLCILGSRDVSNLMLQTLFAWQKVVAKATNFLFYFLSRLKATSHDMEMKLLCILVLGIYVK